MKTERIPLSAGLWLSLAVHIALISGLFLVPPGKPPERRVIRQVLVPVSAHAKEPETLKKPEPTKPLHERKITKDPVKTLRKKIQDESPLSHIRKETRTAEKSEEVKPVFGVSRNSVSEDPGPGNMAMRVGNTLAKGRDNSVTPPEKVKDYVTVPLFELSTMPEFRQRVTPDYPAALKKKDIAGEVVLSVVIDASGRVVEVKVVRSTHELFTKAAVMAVKKSLFIPATRNGSPVATTLEDLVYSFILDG
jgi:TonB family protein